MKITTRRPTKLWAGSLQEKDQSDDLDVDWMTILKYTLDKYVSKGVDWIYVDQDRDL
jgi:hypothetical protein